MSSFLYLLDFFFQLKSFHSSLFAFTKQEKFRWLRTFPQHFYFINIAYGILFKHSDKIETKQKLRNVLSQLLCHIIDSACIYKYTWMRNDFNTIHRAHKQRQYSVPWSSQFFLIDLLPSDLTLFASHSFFLSFFLMSH